MSPGRDALAVEEPVNGASGRYRWRSTPSKSVPTISRSISPNLSPTVAAEADDRHTLASDTGRERVMLEPLGPIVAQLARFARTAY